MEEFIQVGIWYSFQYDVWITLTRICGLELLPMFHSILLLLYTLGGSSSRLGVLTPMWEIQIDYKASSFFLGQP